MIGRWANIAIIFFSSLFILYKTIYPLDFFFKETYSNLGYYFLLLGGGKSHIRDVLENILLFIPFGFGLAGYLVRAKKLEGVTSLVITTSVCIGLSWALEVLQIFQPSRFPSLFDVISNGTGGIFGYLCFLLWESKVKVTNYISAFVKNNLLLTFLIYAILAFIISIPLQQTTSLSNWDKTFHLLLGNERTGDRPWRGYIHEVYIADRAISETEVAHAFSKKHSIASLGDSLLASYQLTGIGGYHDKIGNLPDLVWKGEPQDVQQGEGVLLGHNNWLETEAPAEYLLHRIVETSQFTIGITVSTSDTIQTGPARIVSLSEDTSHRNFTLGQQGTDLVFRLRTPLTGENGTNPQLMVPDVFSTLEPQNLVITYDGSVLSVYVNEKLNSHELELNPGAALFSTLFPLNTYNIMGFKVFYYSLVFIPLSILMGFRLKIMRKGFVIKMFLISGGIVIPSLVLETILLSVSGRSVIFENLLISMIFTASPMVYKVCYCVPCWRKLN